MVQGAQLSDNLGKDDERGWWVGGRSKREVMYVYMKLIHFIVQQKLTQNCKATIPPIK